jgi:hypothetical protein
MQQQALCLKEDDAKTSEITLKGSVEIVSDFFFTAINSILYQRGEWNEGMPTGMDGPILFASSK